MVSGMWVDGGVRRALDGVDDIKIGACLGLPTVAQGVCCYEEDSRSADA